VMRAAAPLDAGASAPSGCFAGTTAAARSIPFPETLPGRGADKAGPGAGRYDRDVVRRRVLARVRGRSITTEDHVEVSGAATVRARRPVGGTGIHAHALPFDYYRPCLSPAPRDPHLPRASRHRVDTDV
jgi:hypothetical protein